ncbi:ETX/MTX2 family pore-forming toxin [Tenacibaculum sp. TC6]|uniref:ETX/MTX2 family pore-forming toxin n=1 Tax=Tenacibaculum sp. TC6 TaxID=3423223 RepID=UPI003D35FA2D
MKKIIVPLTLITFLGYSCSNSDELVTMEKNLKSTNVFETNDLVNLSNQNLKLTGNKAQETFKEIISNPNDWTLITEKGNKVQKLLNRTDLINLPATSPMGIQGLRKLGVTNDELLAETRTNDKWLASISTFEPYAIFFNDEDALNNTYGYTPKYVGENNFPTYGLVPFSIKLGEPSINYDKSITDGKEVYEFTIVNNSDEIDNSSHSYTYEQGVQEEVTVSTGVSLGFEAQIGVPMFAESKFSVGVELSSGYTHSINSIKTISATYNATMPPRTKRTVRIVVDVVDLSARYNIPYTLEGNFEAYYYYTLEYFGGRTTPDGDKTRNIFPASLLEKYLGTNNSSGGINYLKKSNFQLYAGPAVPL